MKVNPPFIAPAAPVGAGTVEVVALRDVHAERGGKQVLVHPKGHRQQLEAAVARELVRTRSEDYALTDAGEAVLHPQTGEPIEPGTGATATPINAALQPTAPATPNIDPNAPGSVETGNGGKDGGGQTEESFDLLKVPGVNDAVARGLEDAKLGTLAALRGATVEDLQAVKGIGPMIAKQIHDHVQEIPTKKGG